LVCLNVWLFSRLPDKYHVSPFNCQVALCFTAATKFINQLISQSVTLLKNTVSTIDFYAKTYLPKSVRCEEVNIVTSNIFSQKYFSNGRAVVMVVVRPSVRPSVCSPVGHGCTVAKRCKIEPRLLLITNRKSRTGFQMTYKSMTLNDFEGH